MNEAHLDLQVHVALVIESHILMLARSHKFPLWAENDDTVHAEQTRA
jgi:hypothetical protein